MGLFIFVIANVVNTIVIHTKGIDITTWQYWASLLLVSLIYIAGRMSE